MSHDRQVSTIRKRTRDDNSDGTEDEMELIAIVSGFIMVVLGAWSDRFKHKYLPWNEHERAIKRAYWLDSLMNDRICKEHWLTRGGLVTTRNVTVLEVIAFFLHTLAHDLKSRTIGTVFTRSGETVSRQFHTVLKALMKIGNFYIKQMDDILTRVLLEEINNKEKGDGDFKPQAYQAIVDELKKELGITINVDHESKNAAHYRNKAVGDGSEQHDEAADVMEGEMVSKGRSSSKDPTNSSSRKRKKDSVADAVNSFAESFREYVQSKIKDTPRPTCEEIHTVVSQVFGISMSQIMRVVKRFMNGNPGDFLM
ncbi:Werner syndrome ATP-dependent helicase-like protein [Bienertia sinuspersici]